MKRNYSDRYVYQLRKLYQRPFIKGEVYTAQEVIDRGWSHPAIWHSEDGIPWIKINFKDYLNQIEDDAKNLA